MHELSIAQSIVQLAEQQARKHQATEIEELELEIGSLAGVELHTLEFALESSVKGTMLNNARIVRHDIAGEGRCGDCEAVFPVDVLFSPCPHCGSYCVSILKGKELRIKSIVVKNKTKD
ncbi:hydrogenase nickel incorporation protein HypA/HybF [Dysgonomonas sp. PFB1-18]|uniref:hydrogenase maturation nickel metallochaperone HypA n=1 Tax=unclassified Dysgonomonas TaxID=2630389 RepID=UPI002476BF0F|nr:MULTISPECIES: hydrogenase maturation nickel metallochaperone HypA [unclassified Dysgonomonas]MDL2302991.1 hydrogenase maturation nickel metallochaperone HypA [Dysgonomonas sp. OttesenSCG-928-D17]MDH6309562.1 hydrogenase nickel incorporation protein HypA/HybF [Dysgonomonas sp. PF1-14]MDH6339110.1 hydrogenase nickel incorporation protein HypA/HybF [Dysgonomonas sp. PF1-16]MDH6380604.1 hydrogenase nickel incorporation protein HypA/HybF [Dysgonomonas sp. PFB1-18]MDH6398100.1 hydrogenase nickel 